MNTQMNYQFYGLASYMSRHFQISLLESGKSLPFYKKKEALMRCDGDTALSRISSLEGWQIYRVNSNELLANCGKGCLRVQIDVRKHGENSCAVELWSVTAEAGMKIFDDVCSRLDVQLTVPSAVNVKWCYINDSKEVETQPIMEEVDERIHPAAYPWLPDALDSFALRYMSSKEPILILHGPPGTGKTRLIRHILASISRQRGKPAEVLYATDSQIMQSDSFFLKFMTEASDAMVIEDADHLLEPRNDGNSHLHRFLSCSDGLLLPHGRKMIFSTNLPSRLSLDEALLRPGRCFACVSARKLTEREASDLIAEIVDGDVLASEIAIQRLVQKNTPSFSVAEIYASVNETNHDSTSSGIPLSEVNSMSEAIVSA